MFSMTGYGRGEASNGEISVLVEMKSVNNRFCDVNARLPRDYMALEPRLQKMVKARIPRGRVDVFLRRQTMESGPSLGADAVLARKVSAIMQEVATAIGHEGGIPIEVILNHPGVLSQKENDIDAIGEWEMVSTALEAALDDLIQMRKTEGEVLQQDLRGNLDELQRGWAEVSAVADGISERLRQRLEERLGRLLGDKVDPGRLAQEAAILADKADIAEELARIRSHCKQFSDALTLDEPIGRKLDFLLQELNREVNTIGSKAAEHPVSSRVVEMKSTLERMREQAANVE
jgi:uncharacterized protein (TIGR00255 family)